MQASFSVTGGSAQGVAFQSFGGTADYEGRAVKLDARLQQNASAFLTAVGTIPVPTGPGEASRTDVFDLQLKSSPIDVALFQAATTEVTNLSGQMLADMHVGGTME